ncbi:MAG: serine/threonine protein kinase, partial [Verrucomicrobiales bacterium]|nr:serine/threonine protein kinase [Verrucomicrobiales bacterium]
MRIPTEEQWCRVEALSEELAGLAPDEVERRLQSLARQGESPTVLAHLRPWLALPPDSPDPGPGSVVGGGYTLVEKLGRGGMGVVWRATQQSVGRDVALKIIHPVLVSPALRKRAVDEIRLLGRLNHPGIVRIFDAGFHEDPRHGRIPFFAMEWVEGVSLDRWAQAHRDDARSKLRLMVAVCEAVQAAHDRRIVHRDLKPANILVREDGSPVVLDFGIARLVGMGEEGEANVFSGTPEYAAPEQHLGKDQDFRSGESVDVYALGVILFELMAGRRFLPVPSGASPSEIRRAVLEGHLPRLSDTMAGCPPELDEVVRRAVRRDPADRFYSVSALGLAVARVAASMGGTAEPVRRWESEAGALVPGTRWRLQEKLGEGGTGEVWAGRHEELGTRCVFKFCSTEETARTLKREFTLFRLLKERVGRNPHFVQLLEVSLDEPPWYLMMDYEEARDLESWCANRPGGLAALPLEARIEIVAQAAEALQAAHEAGILHRDIKPANLLVRGGTAGTSDLHVLVADFGIGQLVLDLVVPNDARLGFTRTVSGLQRSKISGTMLYLAPEVLEGEAATARSDVYSLGVVLWQLLVGNLNAALDVTDWPARISDPLLREDLQRCLAGLPGKRWASAGELAASLRALPARTADAARRRAELAARERAAYRRGVVRSACITVGILGMVAVIGWYAFDRDRAARVNAFSTQVAELANLALGSFPNRAATAATLVRGTPPRTEDERRALADAYVRVLELDDWVVDSAPASEAFRSDIVAAAAEPTFRYVLRYARPSGLEAMDLDTGRVERLPADDLFSGRTPGPTQAGEDSGVGIDSEVPTSAPEPGEGVVLALARRAVRAAVASGDTLRIFGDAPLKAEATLRTEHPVASLAWNSRGDLLAVGMASANGEGMVELRAAPSWSTVRRLTKTDENPYSRRPTGLAFSPDDARLAQWSLDSLHLLFWDVAKGELVA